MELSWSEALYLGKTNQCSLCGLTTEGYESDPALYHWYYLQQIKNKTKHPFIKWPIIVRAPLAKEQHITLPKEPTTKVSHLIIDFWQHAVLSVSLQPLENPNTVLRL